MDTSNDGMILNLLSNKGGNTEFYELLIRIANLHSKKSRDYDKITGTFDVFDSSAMFTKRPSFVPLVFAETKWNRLKSLLSNDRKPNYEGISDNILDIVIYLLIFSIKYEQEMKK